MTILLMVLLSILAVGMLSLSAVTLRSSSQTSAMSEARANARVALMLAIGELQRYTGPDTRITAPAEVIEAGAPPLTGVWKSWEGTNHDSNGRPIAPAYDTTTGKYTVKTTTEANGGRFLTWLVSGAEPGSEPTDTGNKPTDLVLTSSSSGTIPLLSEGSLGSNPDPVTGINPGEVHVTPFPVKDEGGATTGSYAWWVSPENQKARLAQPYSPRTTSAEGWAEMAKSHAVPDPEPFGLDVLLDDPESYTPVPGNPKLASRAISLDTTELLVSPNAANPQQSFHDLSTSATGLLTNTATGGWRKDMSIFAEKWAAVSPSPLANLPASGLPLFRLTPATASSVTKPTTSNPRASKSIFYPWSEYSSASISGNPNPSDYVSAHGAVASWESLVNFATAYKNIDYNFSTGTGSIALNMPRTHRITPWSGTPSPNFTNQDLFKYLHTTHVAPVLGRVQ